jgi:hypothetical protein
VRRAARQGLAGLGLALALGIGGDLAGGLAAGAAPAVPPIRFEEIGAAAGARLVHHTRAFSGRQAGVLGMFTSGGAAVAVADYDNDGRLDLFVTDSSEGGRNHLLHNESPGKGGGLAFRDVAEAAGVAGGNDHLQIVADALWFDYDNDGWEDLLVVRFGTPLLYHNERNGRFRDVSRTSGLDKFGNSLAAVAFDYDNDGRLDLLFGNYFKPVNLIELKDRHVLPDNLDQATNGGGVTLWHNEGWTAAGDVRFVETTAKAGFGKHTGWTLDVGHGDLDNDGWQDVYLADDYGTDRLFWNNRDGTFTDGTEKTIGIDTKKGMNVDIADYDHDGWEDVYVTNITDEYMKECNMLWHNNGPEAPGRRPTFTDVSKETGTCATLWGWGAKFGDFDDDGWEDLMVADGLRSAGRESYIPVLLEMIIRPGVDFTDVHSWPDIGDMSWSGHQKKKLFRNLGNGSFQEMAAAAGVDNDLDGRGIGVGDFDNDGRLDFYQTNAAQPALLYHNVTAAPGHWIELELAGTKSNRDAIGARVSLTAGGLKLLREVDGGNGYASQSSRRLHFGLGRALGSTVKVDAKSPAKVDAEIRWPSGRVERVSVPIDRLSKVREGSGVIPR